MKVIDTVESSAAQVRHQYEANITALNDVQQEQNTVIDELSQIENELDSILPQYDHYFNELGLAGIAPGAQDGDLRDKVYSQATQLDASVDTLNSELTEVRRRIDEYQLRH